jgi:hypothetical protein
MVIDFLFDAIRTMPAFPELVNWTIDKDKAMIAFFEKWSSYVIIG